MPSLDYMLVTPQPLNATGGGTSWSPAGQPTPEEAFDQVMNRAMSPAGANPANGAMPAMGGGGNSPTPQVVGQTPAMEDDEFSNTDPGETATGGRLPFIPANQPPATKVPAWQTANETGTATAATAGATVPAPNPTPATTISKSDAGKGSGAATGRSPVPSATAGTAEGWAGMLALLTGTLPSGVTPQLLTKAAKTGGSDEATGLATPEPPTTATATGLATRTGAKTEAATTAAVSTAEGAADKVAAELISSLKPDRGLKAPGKAGEPAGAKMNAGGIPAATALADAAKEPAVTGAGPAVATGPAHSAGAESDDGVDWSGEAMTAGPLETAGTSVANQSMAMNKSDKTNKVAGLTGKTEKVLPGDGDSAAPGNNLPVADPHAKISAPGESSLMVGGAAANGSDPAVASGAAATVSAVVDIHTRALERTHDMVALHALRLVDSKSDSLNVVIKPGAGLQLSLEMRQRGDGIDIHAVLQHGDFEHLNQHWPELQERLEQRGVRLSTLTEGTASMAGDSNGGFQSPQHGFASTDPLETSAFAAFALAGPALVPANSSPVPAMMLRGWESWA
jgi:hypothetical protein